MKKKPGLYANINAKRKRIAAGSGEKMRKPGTKGAPSAMDFIQSAQHLIHELKQMPLERKASVLVQLDGQVLEEKPLERDGLARYNTK